MSATWISIIGLILTAINVIWGIRIYFISRKNQLDAEEHKALKESIEKIKTAQDLSNVEIASMKTTTDLARELIIKAISKG